NEDRIPTALTEQACKSPITRCLKSQGRFVQLRFFPGESPRRIKDRPGYGCQDSASHLTPVLRMSPRILIFCFILPISCLGERSESGINFAIGFPRLRITSPEGSNSSRILRQLALNSLAFMLFCLAFIFIF